jgi:hypothetical protein
LEKHLTQRERERPREKREGEGELGWRRKIRLGKPQTFFTVREPGLDGEGRARMREGARLGWRREGLDGKGRGWMGEEVLG